MPAESWPSRESKSKAGLSPLQNLLIINNFRLLTISVPFLQSVCHINSVTENW